MSAARYLAIVLTFLLTASCSVISRQVRTEAEPAVPFEILVEEADRYLGKTVILGGYILETRNLADETVIEVLQVPLGLGGEPKPKDLSEGRFSVSHQGFLDPAIYSKDRMITVAGTLSECRVEGVKTCWLESREIYLWPEYGYRYPYPYSGYPYYRHPYYGHGHYYHHRHHHRHRHRHLW